jgi:hypothetical protein
MISASHACAVMRSILFMVQLPGIQYADIDVHNSTFELTLLQVL